MELIFSKSRPITTNWPLNTCSSVYVCEVPMKGILFHMHFCYSVDMYMYVFTALCSCIDTNTDYCAHRGKRP